MYANTTTCEPEFTKIPQNNGTGTKQMIHEVKLNNFRVRILSLRWRTYITRMLYSPTPGTPYETNYPCWWSWCSSKIDTTYKDSWVHWGESVCIWLINTNTNTHSRNLYSTGTQTAVLRHDIERKRNAFPPVRPRTSHGPYSTSTRNTLERRGTLFVLRNSASCERPVIVRGSVVL